MIKREAKEATKRGEHFDPASALEVKFLRNLIEEFLEVVFSTCYLVLLWILNFFLVIKELMPAFFNCARHLVPRSSLLKSISMEMMNRLMLIDWNKLMMLVSCTVRDLWNFLLIF